MTRFESARRLILTDLRLGETILGVLSAVAVPTAIRWVLGVGANPVPFVTYFPFMLLAAIFLGWRWAALATLASAVLVSRVFLAEPWLENPGSADLAILIFFTVSCAVLIFIGDTLRRTVRMLDGQLRANQLLSDELHHRVTNIVAVVEALVRTSRSDTDVTEFREDLVGRLHALANANRILRDGSDSKNAVRDLVTLATSPFEDDGNFTLEGPDCSLPAEPAHHLLLLIHELSTNAVKHGALTRPDGQVSISWSADGPDFRMRWVESGGPAVSPPSRAGLGLKLLQAQPAFEVVTHFREAGLVCEISRSA